MRRMFQPRSRLVWSLISVMLVVGICEAFIFRSSGDRAVRKLDTDSLRIKFGSEIDSAIQAGRIEGYVSTKGGEDGWTGSKYVTVTARYTATFGIPMGFIDKGLRIEHYPSDGNPTNLVVYLRPPEILGSAAIDTESIKLTQVRSKRLGSFWNTDQYKVQAVGRMSPAAQRDAVAQVNAHDNREMTRRVVRDLILDTIEAVTSPRVRRQLASRVIVVFEDESEMPLDLLAPPSGGAMPLGQ